MNIKNNKGFYYYKTNDFATMYIRHYFNYENTKENCIKSMILSKYLIKTNEVYKTAKEISDKSKELYGLNVLVRQRTFGSKTMLSFELKMVNPRVIEEDYFLDALNFYKCIMLKPNFKDGKLDNELFNLIKNEIINKKKNEFKDPSIMNERLFYKNVIPNSDINNHNIADEKEFDSIINNIKDIDIINFYNEIINNYISSFAVGNLLDKEIKLIENTFNFKQIDFDYKYDYKDEIVNNDIEIISKDTTQSNIYFVYDIKDYDLKKSYMYDALNTMLLYNSGPIYNVYRTNLGIMYAGYAGILYNNGLLFIKIDIDKKNQEKSINGLKDVFNILHDKKEVSKLLKYAKEKRKELLNSHSEDILSIVKEVENYTLKYDLFEKDKLKLINKLTIDDVINQINNLEYKCMYFYKGDKDEK